MYLTQRDVSDYHRDGFVLVDELFSAQEVERLIQEVEQGERVEQATYGSSDGSGRAAKLALWYDLGDDVWSAASTCPRIVNNVRILLGEEACFFHGKVMLKEARSGGAWEWHQDYGYWYNQGFLFPNMISAFIALDEATVENGCLQVLRGSHTLGRLDHVKVGQQTGADPARIPLLEERFERVHCTMKPGSALFFHSNLLHASAANDSPHHRRSFIMCYNAWDNPQLSQGQVMKREPCPVGKNDAILHNFSR